MNKPTVSVIFLITTTALIGCTPSSKELATALTPPSFSDVKSRVTFANDGDPVFPEFISTLTLSGSAYTGRIEMDITFGDISQPLYYFDEQLSRFRFYNPQTPCDLGPIPNSSILGERVYYCAFDGYLNYQLLNAGQVAYRWVATLRLKEGGNDTITIESPIYIVSPNAGNYWTERSPTINQSTHEATEPINASRWQQDGAIE
jgi:hypothetical protein